MKWLIPLCLALSACAKHSDTTQSTPEPKLVDGYACNYSTEGFLEVCTDPTHCTDQKLSDIYVCQNTQTKELCSVHDASSVGGSWQTNCQGLTSWEVTNGVR